MKIENLTYQDIREASSNYLRSLLKEDIDVELHDMVTKELFEVREQRRSINEETRRHSLRDSQAGTRGVSLTHIRAK